MKPTLYRPDSPYEDQEEQINWESAIENYGTENIVQTWRLAFAKDEHLFRRDAFKNQIDGILLRDLYCERWHPNPNHPLWGCLGHVHCFHPLMPITSAATRLMNATTHPNMVAIFSALLRPSPLSEDALIVGEEADDEDDASAEVVDGVKPDRLMRVLGKDADVNVGVDIIPSGLSAVVVERAGSVAPKFVAFCP